MKLSDLLVNVEYTAQNSVNPEITDIIYDSRKVSDGTAFVCLKGYTSDGHKFAKSAVEKGASALVISDELDFEVPQNVAVIKTQDTRLALALMSAEFFGNPARELKTVAITGTKGKTTTTAMVAEIFEQAGIKQVQSARLELFTAAKRTKPTTQRPNPMKFRRQCVI